ncbi:MAG: DUF2183 domain-containing protein [Saprospiraceae bacterium]|nr:DUF2183 domain-containing protein [Saprospiraceae bacterium]
MNKIFEFFQNSVEEAEEWLHQITRQFKGDDPIIILPYRGYANEKRLFFKGRVLEDESFWESRTKGELSNLMASFKRFDTDEIPFAKVSIQVGERTFDVQADHEGYFTLDTHWDPPELQPINHWLKADLQLTEVENSNTDRPVFKTTGEIFLPAPSASYGVITDVDDTVLQTHVTSRLRFKMLYATFMQNAEERLPMEGVVELFQAFAKGEKGIGNNPIFYVSNSPWNLYDLLEKFMEFHELPKGPIFLRDYGIRPAGEFSQHKLATISRILDTYPDLPFIMLGDTASKDADFYIQLAEQYPGRIKAIYIRLTKNNKNARRVAELIETKSNTNAVLVHSSQEIRTHAESIGLL